MSYPIRYCNFGPPSQPPPLVLNRRFKKATIQLSEQAVLVISVQQAAGQCSLVFSQCQGSFDNRTSSLGVPEPLVVPFVQQLHKLSKWRPSTSSGLPSGRALPHESGVFRSQIVSLGDGPGQTRQYAVEIFKESDRRELGRLLIPLDSNRLTKVKEAVNDALVAADPSMYNALWHRASDGSKLYFDLVTLPDCDRRCLKISQVTRHFRCILHLPAEDVRPILSNLNSCIAAYGARRDSEVRRRRRRKMGRTKKVMDADKKVMDADKKVMDADKKVEDADKVMDADKKVMDADKKTEEADKKAEDVKTLA